MDGRAGLGLGCSRLLLDPREVDAATLRERKKQDGFHLVFSDGVQTVTLTRRLFVHSHSDKFVLRLSDTKRSLFISFKMFLALNFIV